MIYAYTLEASSPRPNLLPKIANPSEKQKVTETQGVYASVKNRTLANLEMPLKLRKAQELLKKEDGWRGTGNWPDLLPEDVTNRYKALTQEVDKALQEWDEYPKPDWDDVFFLVGTNGENGSGKAAILCTPNIMPYAEKALKDTLPNGTFTKSEEHDEAIKQTLGQTVDNPFLLDKPWAEKSRTGKGYVKDINRHRSLRCQVTDIGFCVT